MTPADIERERQAFREQHSKAKQASAAPQMVGDQHVVRTSGFGQESSQVLATFKARYSYDLDVHLRHDWLTVMSALPA